MKRITIIVMFLLLSSLMYAQSQSEIESLCQKAVEATQDNDFTTAKQNYDSAISLISKTPNSDLVLIIPEDLWEYIIVTQARVDQEEAQEIAMNLLELQMLALKYLYSQNYFNSQGEFLDNNSFAMISMGYTLAEAGLIKEAEECCHAGVLIYHQAEYYTSEYPLGYERLGYLYGNYFKDYANSLYYSYEGFKAAVKLYGLDSELTKEIFVRLSLSYTSKFLFTDYTVEFTDKYKNEGVVYPTYKQIEEITSLWDSIRNDIILSYGFEAYEELLNVRPVSLYPGTVFGNKQWDLLYKALSAIYYDQMEDYEDICNEIINTFDDFDNLLLYFKQVIDSLCHHNYVNLAIELYDKLVIKSASKKELIEMIEYERANLCSSYGFYDEVGKYLSDLPNNIDQYKYNNTEAFILKLDLLSGKYRIEKNYNKALSIKNKAIEIANTDSLIVPKYLRRNLYTGLAALYHDLSLYDKSIDAANIAIRIGQSLALDLDSDPNDPRNVCWPVGAYGNLAGNYLVLGKIDEAENILNNCITYNYSNFPNVDNTHYYDGLMYVAEVRKDYAKMRDIAEKSYYENIRTYLAQSMGMTKVQRTDYWSLHQYKFSAFQILCDFALKTELFTDIAYDASLIYKGFLLNYDKIIAENIAKSQDWVLIEAYNEFKRAESNGSNDRYALEENVMRLYSKHPEFKRNVSFATWKDVQQNLVKGDLAVEFTKCCSDGKTVSYAALLLQPGWVRPVIVRLASEHDMDALLAKGARAYLDNERFYSMIWGQIEPYLTGVKRIYFSPYGVLSQLNIEVLQNGKGKPMNKEYDMYRVSSTADLYKGEMTSYASATLFGGLNYDLDTDSMRSISRGYSEGQWFTSLPIELEEDLTRKGWNYLPGTKKEVEQISGILDKESIKNVTIMADSGTEESFKALSGRSTPILHVATHGFYISEKQAERSNPSLLKKDQGDSHIYPLRRCGLMMSGGQHAWLGEDIPEGIDDGILTAEEIAGLNLTGTDLLVLSACQTGLGEIGGDGVYGLQRGFKIAGVNTIIMSLWEVSDAATEVLMTKFYSLLVKGKSKREAFDAAVAAVKKEYESPEYWAAFIMLD